MIVTIAIALLLLSILVIAILLLKRDWFNAGGRYLFARFAFALFGAAALLLGIYFFQRAGILAAFFGTFLTVLGIQIALWALGVSGQLLGNAPMISRRVGNRARYSDTDRWGDRYEESEPVDDSITRLGKVVSQVSRFVEQLYEMESQRSHNELRRYEVEVERLAEEQKKRESEEHRLRMTKTFRSERHKGPFRQFYNRLLVAIGILAFAKEHAARKNLNELQVAFRSEVNRMLEIVTDNADLFFRIKLDEKVKPFIDNSAAFRFEPLQKVTAKLDLLIEIADKLKAPPSS